MIHVHTEFAEQTCLVEISGHAGYAPEGQDIVCAAVSAMALALHSYLDAHPEVCIRAERKTGGSACFLFRRTPASQAACEMASLGLYAIAAEYPEHVRTAWKTLR